MLPLLLALTLMLALVLLLPLLVLLLLELAAEGYRHQPLVSK